MGWYKDLGWTDAASLAKKHLQMAMKNPTARAHRVASYMLLGQRQQEEAIAEAERAMAMAPNDADSHMAMGRALTLAGRSREGIDFIKRGMRLDPYYAVYYLGHLGLAQFCMGKFEEAAITLERAQKRNPAYQPWSLAAAYGHLGREQEAQDLIAEYMKRRGWKHRVTVKRLLKYFPFKDPKDRDRFVEGLRKAGLK